MITAATIFERPLSLRESNRVTRSAVHLHAPEDERPAMPPHLHSALLCDLEVAAQVTRRPIPDESYGCVDWYPF